eukprot:jgi/Mesen1/3500/ME000197S02515
MDPFNHLPLHLLQEFLRAANLSGRDLASLESTCYSLRKAAGNAPNRRSSVVEVSAYQRCISRSYLQALPDTKWLELLKRAGGSWKQVLCYLQAFEMASGFEIDKARKKRVHAGCYQTLIIEGGRLYQTGAAAKGHHAAEVEELYAPYPRLVEVPGGARVLQVSANILHVALATDDGQVYTYGVDSHGSLGHGGGAGEEGAVVVQPKLVEALRGVSCKQVAAGARHTLALTRDGHVYSWGDARAGADSDSDHGHNGASRPLPALLETLKRAGEVLQISSGSSHSLAVTREGGVYAWGVGDNGRLGCGDARDRRAPCQVAGLDEQRVFAIQAVAGDEQSAVIDACGKVYTWGRGYCYSLGHGDEVDVFTPKLVKSLSAFRVVQVAMRKRKTLVLDDRGRVYGCGWSASGSLGIRRNPTVGGVDPGPAASLDHKIFNFVGSEVLPNELPIVQISTGWYHTAAVTRENRVIGFGDADSGQLGAGGTEGSFHRSITVID